MGRSHTWEKRNLSRNSGQKEEASRRSRTNTSTGPDNRCPRGWLMCKTGDCCRLCECWLQFPEQMAKVAGGFLRGSSWAFTHILHVPGFTDGQWRRWSLCVLCTLINYRGQSPSSYMYKINSQHLCILCNSADSIFIENSFRSYNFLYCLYRPSRFLNDMMFSLQELGECKQNFQGQRNKVSFRT